MFIIYSTWLCTLQEIFLVPTLHVVTRNVDEAKHWRYSSARDYESVDGLLEVEHFW